MNFNKKLYLKENVLTNKKRDQLLKLVKVILVLKTIISKYQELQQRYTKKKRKKI